MSDAGRKFIIEQDMFRGPIDLLYYLIQQKELDISEVSLARITDQYISFMEILKDLDLDNIGEFLDIAATLLQAKARSLFPEEAEEADEDEFDPTSDLISELLEYKRYKLAGKILADKRSKQEEMFPKGYAERFDFEKDEEGNPVEEVDLNNLLSVFTELMEQTMRNLPVKIVYDDISIEDHIDNIVKKLENGPGIVVTFREFVTGSGSNVPSREFMSGTFIACLELTRRHVLKITQTRDGGEIRVELMSEQERAQFEEPEDDITVSDGRQGPVSEESQPEEGISEKQPND